MTEATFVFRHVDEAEARRFCKELFASYPFGGNGPTCVTACAVGDAMSVSDAVRMALLCDALDFDMERREFALEMAACNNWDDCMALAAKWELREDGGEFVDARPASGIEAPSGGETGTLTRPKARARRLKAGMPKRSPDNDHYS